ncbi:hypothetical protein L6164_012911 [Bauhinia variegata]|uniref:Uncharacterized protein n=1 Tax=Bauhinia variegata TaxID=167791 RepID=A0ACB9PD09_BAUVA|nr:hypothetical protein L6164_012911 [Bauhinia variegata]
MVLGIRSKSRKSIPIQVHFVIHVQEIKPWPPSQSLRSAQSVLLQWENGDQNFGSFASSAGDGKLEFNESFRLSALLLREASKKGTNRDGFQKNCLEFYLYESQNGKTAKSQLLGSATINIADYGIIKETTAISTAVNCKKSFRNSAQPFLYLNVQPFDIGSSSSSPKSNLSKELSLDKEESESVSRSLNYEDLEISSFTDDDDEHVSSISSQTVHSTSKTAGESSTRTSIGGTKGFNREFILPLETKLASSLVKVEAESNKQLNGIKSPLSSMVLSSDTGNALNDSLSLPKSHEESVKVADGSYKIRESIHQSSRKNITRDVKEKILSSASYIPVDVQSNVENTSQSQMIKGGSRRGQRFNEDGPKKLISFSNTSILEGKEEKELKGKGEEEKISMGNKLEEKVVNLLEDDSRRKGKLKSATLPLSRKSHERPMSILKKDNEPEDVKSHKLPLDTFENNGLFSRNQGEGNNALKDSQKVTVSHSGSNVDGRFPNNKADMKSEVEMLREELQEAAALEISLYSVVADHGSSANKVHAPARRLSRFYFHAYRVGSPATRASAAQSAVSGFVLVSKACGNDVPRLTFWLSNLILLRAILSKGVEKIRPAEDLCFVSECDGSGSIGGSSLKRSHPHNNEEKENTAHYSSNWEDPKTFLIALEKVEAWIFSRIVESVWWQTLTPHMQSAAAKSSSARKIYRRRYSLGDQEQGNFSIDLWKRAFKDACERLCPLRAGGHECGCLRVIARLVMEQLINRLDVAMFNAILRESDEEMPTDPISDPISDSKVLPIPAGKSGFGTGAQLKNAIGNWSRWLSDLFGIDDSDSAEDRNENDDNKGPECQTQTPFKAFHLLNALSDLMMLPFEMLADRSIRKEVCPRFGVPLIKRVLYNFVPDEFCPGPIPDAVLEALDAEDLEDDEGSLTNFPSTAASTLYSPPGAASVMGILQEVGGQISLSASSVLKKSYTSDDELDDLDSPLSAIGIDDLSLLSTLRKGRGVVRYELLRQVWRDSE